MTTRIDAIRARLEAATELGMDAREDPTFRAHAPEDIAYLLGRVEECPDICHGCSSRVKHLEAEIARLRDGLRKYGRHRLIEGGCRVGAIVAPTHCPAEDLDGRRAPTGACTCGLDSLLSGSGEGG